jgi:hypothetical protein
MKSSNNPPWRYPCVGSPAVGTEKSKCGINPKAKVPNSKIVALLRGRSMLANAESGDFGERMLTWNINRTKRRKEELLSLARNSKGEILEKVEVDGVSMDNQVEGAKDCGFREIFEGRFIETQ